MVCRVSRPDDLSSVWMISKVSGSSKLCLAGVKYLDDPSDLKSFQMIWKVFTWLFRDNFKFGPKNDQKRSKTRPSKQCKSLIWILVFVFPVLICYRKRNLHWNFYYFAKTKFDVIHSHIHIQSSWAWANHFLCFAWYFEEKNLQLNNWLILWSLLRGGQEYLHARAQKVNSVQCTEYVWCDFMLLVFKWYSTECFLRCIQDMPWFPL